MAYCYYFKFRKGVRVGVRRQLRVVYAVPLCHTNVTGGYRAGEGCDGLFPRAAVLKLST